MSWIANIGQGAAEIESGKPDTVVISITEPGSPARLMDGWHDILRLEFRDYDSLCASCPDSKHCFTVQMAGQAARFARKHRGKNILIHCAAGISRSGAMAVALLQAFPEYEDKGWDRHPNGHVLGLMKRALGLVPIGADDAISQ